jgi:hypothetical protein
MEENFDSFIEILDNEKGKLIVKTKILASSDGINSHNLLKFNNEKRDRHGNIYKNADHNLSLKSLNHFEWDNLDEYKQKEEKTKNQVKKYNPISKVNNYLLKSQLNFFNLFKEAIFSRFDKDKLVKMIVISIFTIILNLIIFKS